MMETLGRFKRRYSDDKSNLILFTFRLEILKVFKIKMGSWAGEVELKDY